MLVKTYIYYCIDNLILNLETLHTVKQSSVPCNFSHMQCFLFFIDDYAFPSTDSILQMRAGAVYGGTLHSSPSPHPNLDGTLCKCPADAALCLQSLLMPTSQSTSNLPPRFPRAAKGTGDWKQPGSTQACWIHGRHQGYPQTSRGRNNWAKEESEIFGRAPFT